MKIQAAIGHAVVREICGRPDCPQEVLDAWENYREFWLTRYPEDGHWSHVDADKSELWGELRSAIARHNLLSEDTDNQCP